MPGEELDVQQLSAAVRLAAPVVVTIDGKLGAGKTAVAEILGKLTGLPALSLGSILRAAVVEAKRRRVDLADTVAMEGVIQQMVDVVLGPGGISDAELLMASSLLSANGQVRQAAYARMVAAAGDGCIAAGRAIDQAGFANVDLRVFLRASNQVRARRVGHRIGLGRMAALEKIRRLEQRLNAAGLPSAAPAPGAIVVSVWFGDVERAARQVGGILLRLLERRAERGERVEENGWAGSESELMEACL